MIDESEYVNPSLINPEQNDINILANQKENISLKQQDQIIESFYENIDNLDKEVINSIKESIFKKFFLALFTGEDLLDVIDRNNVRRKIDIGDWIDIAGTVNRYVNVVDDATGTFLFKVPPVIDTSMFKTKSYEVREDNVPYVLSNIFEYAKGCYEKYGQKIITDEAIRKINDIDNEKLNAYLLDWVNIFIRYGYLKREDIEEETVIKNNDLDDFISWD